MITFQSDLLSNNPAYNDSIITYSSTTVTGSSKSDIIIEGNTFTIYPFMGVYRFNFKDIVTSLINQNGFKDSIQPNLNDAFIYDDPSLQLQLYPVISIYTPTNPNTGETVSNSYLFTKRVEQLAFYNQKVNLGNDVNVLLPSNNNFDYDVTYFEGFPFDFAIQGLVSGDTYYFTNMNSAMQTETYSASTNDVKRVFLSDGASNETVDDEIILSSNVNALELYVNGVHSANINIKKVESRCGIYLKWFNQYGAYSYWLFDSVYSELIKTKDLEDIAGRWENLQNLTSTSDNIGKTITKSITTQTIFNQKEYDYVTDLLKSPKVEMYIHTDPFITQTPYSFIGVKIADGGFTFSNKNSNNTLKVAIELPFQNTITL
jgi:hypothetical protein